MNNFVYIQRLCRKKYYVKNCMQTLEAEHAEQNRR